MPITVRDGKSSGSAVKLVQSGVPTGCEPQYRTLAGIVIEGIEDLADIADAVV